MNLREVLDRSADLSTARVYSDPYETVDGTTIISVTRYRAISGAAAPVGIFVVHNGQVSWEPAADVTRIALLGLATAVIATLAVLRRPPWPDLHFTGSPW